MPVMHDAPHPLAGRTVNLGPAAADPRRGGVVISGAEFQLEDWFDRVTGTSWAMADGNFAAMAYGMRAGLLGIGVVPLDDEVVYGKIAGRGHLVHVTELAIPPAPVAGRSCRGCGCTDDHACAEGCAWVGDSFLDEDYDLCTACAMRGTR